MLIPNCMIQPIKKETRYTQSNVGLYYHSQYKVTSLEPIKYDVCQAYLFPERGGCKHSRTKAPNTSHLLYVNFLSLTGKEFRKFNQKIRCHLKDLNDPLTKM